MPTGSETKETVTVTLDRRVTSFVVPGNPEGVEIAEFDHHVAKAIRAALDQETKEPQQTTETAEFRAFDKDGRFGLFTWRGGATPPFGVDEEIAGAQARGRTVVIQKRTVSFSDWEDIR
jgi:hypothetical protein